MRLVADLHLHSKYSYATSRNMDIPAMAEWARMKGIGLLGTADFTHPAWFAELKDSLVEDGCGNLSRGGVCFIPTAEVANIFYRGKRCYRIHTLVGMPGLSEAEKAAGLLSRYGALSSDGRPVVKLDVREMLRMLLDISPRCLVVPAHAWTPYFGVFGSKSGFDSLEECFGDDAGEVFALETGLSSDPAMNWRLSALDRVTLLSNSDAHSPENIGREANVFELDGGRPLYGQVYDAVRSGDPRRFLYTVEFFPEEGKYHFDGNRKAGISIDPRRREPVPRADGVPVTAGVLHRVEDLSDRPPDRVPAGRIPYRTVVPLREIIAEAAGVGKQSRKVAAVYLDMVRHFGSEFSILLDVPEGELLNGPHPRAGEGVVRMRRGEVDVRPGFDGQYGTVRIRWDGRL